MTDEIKKKPSTADRIEIFAQAIIAGKSQSDAYRAAYPTTTKWKADSVHHKASEMARSVQVLARIAELRKQLSDKVLWSREMSVNVLKEIAMEDGYKGSERTAAIKELNAMYGYNSAVKIDHSSTDGTMTPKPALDTSKLSENTMRELLAARQGLEFGVRK